MNNANNSTAEATTVKIVVVGDGNVGKTCLLIVYAGKEFMNDYVPTVFDNYGCTVYVDQKPVNLTLWDTAGQEDYDRLRPLSYPDTNVFLLCFSLVQYSSFVNAKLKWFTEISKHCPSAHVMLVGTKLDLRNDLNYVKNMEARGDPEERVVTYKEGLQLSEELDCAGFVECSAKTKQGLKKVFDEAIRVSLYGRVSKKKKNGKNLCLLL
ncbi:hypothetical protein C9374_011681 [Naegleria lovaniensis]|uniref:Rho family small GTPase n=1 Tax=Naegleria lovaniensis TaxID=51637 RepID=A0AA88GC84_NAELO|nr:uncharacterized protein C9374_011681 [Naegleria lovaniensis]KAG2373796.1 hypothetical protein C9374_011681 [Naegleria lovaniensis]